MHNMGTWPHYKFTVLHNGWSAQRWGQTTRLAASPALGVTKPAGSNGERPVLISRHSGKPDLTLGRAWPHEKSVPLSMAMQLACGPWKYIRFLSVGNRQPHSVGPQVRKANLTSLAIYGTVLTVLIVIVQLVLRLKSCGAKQPHLIAE